VSERARRDKYYMISDASPVLWELSSMSSQWGKVVSTERPLQVGSGGKKEEVDEEGKW
jgi:hypothetical protein